MSPGTLFIDENPVDLIHALLADVQRALASGRKLDNEALLEIEQAARREYGGVMIYCGKRTPPETLSKLVKSDLARGASKRSIAIAYGISESTVTRYSKL